MTKKELLEKCKKEPYYTPLMLFVIFDDDDIIPDMLVKMTFKKTKPQPMTFYVGIESGKLLNAAISKHFNINNEKRNN